MDSATRARAAFSEIEGVTRVLAYGHNGKVHIYCSEQADLTRELVEDQLKTAGLGMRKIKRIRA